MNETQTFARDLKPGQVFRVAGYDTLYTCGSVRSVEGRTSIIYTVDGVRCEMFVRGMSTMFVQS